MKKTIKIVGFLGAVLSINPVSAANEKVCLLRSQLQSWRVIDENALEMTDKRENVYRVNFDNPCPEATIPTATIAFDRAWRDLACLASGFAANITAPGLLGRRVCKIASVIVH